MPNDRNIVRIAGGKSALSSPSFVIEDEGRYYVTVAVVEYDPAAADTPEKKKGVEDVRALYDKAQKEGGGKACKIELSATAAPMNTGPNV